MVRSGSAMPAGGVLVSFTGGEISRAAIAMYRAASAMSVVQSRCGVSAKVSMQGTAESILRERLVGRPRHLERS
jgi:hypothetical protein